MSKSTKIKLVSVAALAALAAACKTVGPDFAAPAAPATAAYALTGDVTPANVTMSPAARQGGVWWAALGSPALDAVIRQALADNPTVAEATASLERAQADLAVVQGGQGYQTQANGGVSRNRINTAAFGFTGFPAPTINLFTIGGAVSYDLDLFGGERRAREEANAKVEARARQADAAYLTLSGNVATQAIRIATLRAQRDTVRAIVASDQRQIDMIRKAEQAGGAAPSAATVGEAQLAQDQTLLPPIERELAQARHQLAQLVGKAPGDWTAPDFDLTGFTRPATVPVSLPSAMVHDRPDIQAAEADLHATTAQIGVADANLYPDVKLSVGLTQTALRPQDIFNPNFSGWNIGPTVRIPFLDRTAKARKEQALADAKVSAARYQATVARAFVQVADALTALAQDQASATTLARSVTVSQQAVKDAQKTYDLGGGPLLAVVDAERQLTMARRQQVAAQGQYLNDLVQLYAATGGNWRS